jgi:phage tail sheath protein FI
VPPSASVAGVIARIDRTRGVWKAPAGTEATIAGVAGLSVSLNDRDGSHLNSLGINGLRSFAEYGHVIWGARTIRGADRLAHEFKYVPVRRVALFIEESVSRGLGWTLVEPFGEPLWSRVRQSVGDFMHGLFVQGAFPASTPEQAFVVRCGTDTMAPEDIALGRLTIVIGFAPLRAGEFVTLTIALHRA